MLGVAGCGIKSGKSDISPIIKIDTAYCIYHEMSAILQADSLHPQSRISSGSKIVFSFGHQYPHVSEPTAMTYEFEIDSSLTHFSYDTSDFHAIAFVREYVSPWGFPPETLAVGRLEGERASDSTWVIREWISDDYREWRRRESYRKARRDPGPQAGFERNCVRRGSN